MKKPNFVDLDRSFVPLERDKEGNFDIGRAWGRRIAGWLDWSDLLKYRRVILLAEASSGKTDEFFYKVQALRAEAKAAFFVRVEDLADHGFEAALARYEDAKAFEGWRGLDESAYGPDGWFFLDSVDEARLNRKSFETALRRLAVELRGSFDRARIFASCRFSDWRGSADSTAIMRLLPVEKPRSPAEGGDADAALLDPIFKEKPGKPFGHEKEKGAATTDDLLVVQLVPLSTEQRRRLAEAALVEEPERFVEAIQQNGLGPLAERPGDLIDLADYWEQNQRFGSLAAMTEHGVRRKLADQPFRADNEVMDSKQTREGAETVAAGLTLTKTFTLRSPGEEHEPGLAAGALDLKDVLPGWSEAKQNVLLRRGLFAPSTYGRVRFHHRGTQEYLAAGWLARLLGSGCPRRTIEDLLFADTYGVPTVVPSLRAAAAWLAIGHPHIRDEILRREPLVLLREGDPGSLPLAVKERLLLTYAERHAQGEISDDSIDHRSLWMFATPALGAAIRSAWHLNDQEEFRRALLRIIREGAIAECLDLAREVALDGHTSDTLRSVAAEALAVCDGVESLSKVGRWLVSNETSVSEYLAANLARLLFPRHLSVEELLSLIERCPSERRNYRFSFDYILGELREACPDIEAQSRFLEGLGRICLTPPFEAFHRRISSRLGSLAKHLEPVARDALATFGARLPVAAMIPLLMAVERSEPRTRGIDEESPGGPSLSDLVNGHQTLKRALFWADVDEVRSNLRREDYRPTTLWQVRFHMRSLWILGEEDCSWLEKDVREKEAEDDRRIAFDSIVQIIRNAAPDAERAAAAVLARRSALEALIDGGGPRLSDDLRLALTPYRRRPEEERELRRALRQRGRDEVSTREAKQSWIDLRAELVASHGALRDPIELREDGGGYAKLRSLTRWLNERTGEDIEGSVVQWRLIEEGFGHAVAESYREGLKLFWRMSEPVAPTVAQNSRTDRYTEILSFSSIGMEAADDSRWASRLIPEHAARAADHARVADLGYPAWFGDLIKDQPGKALPALREILIEGWGADRARRTNPLDYFGRPDRRIPPVVQRLVLDVTTAQMPGNTDVLDDFLRFLSRCSIEAEAADGLIESASSRFHDSRARGDIDLAIRYLALLLQLQPNKAMGKLFEWLEHEPTGSSAKPKEGTDGLQGRAGLPGHAEPVAVRILGEMFGRDDRLSCLRFLSSVDVDLLENLIRQTYRFVRPDDDIHRDGAYSPGVRDAAQTARNEVLKALLDRPGAAAYRAVRRLANEPLRPDLSQRLNELAHGKAEKDSDGPPWQPQEVVNFELAYVAPAKTGEALLRVVLGVLADIADGLTGAGSDASSRPLLQLSEYEDQVQLWLTEQFTLRALGRYNVFRETEVANRDRPDIVVVSTSAPVEVVVELKHSRKWSIRDLETALLEQLAEDYLKPANRRHGVLVVSHHVSSRRWKALEDGAELTFAMVMDRLAELAATKKANGQGPVEIRAVGLDASGPVAAGAGMARGMGRRSGSREGRQSADGGRDGDGERAE